MNETGSAPSSLDPGLELRPRRRVASGGQPAPVAASQPQDAAAEAPEVPGEVEKSTPCPQTGTGFSEADVAAALRLARAVVESGLMTDIPTGSAEVAVSKTSQGDESRTEQGPARSDVGVVDDAGSTQGRIPPTEPGSQSPLPTNSSPSIHEAGGEPDNYHRGTDLDKSRPWKVVGSLPGQAGTEADNNEPKAANEWQGDIEAAEADTDAEVGSKGDTKRQPPTPWLPDKADNFSPRWGWTPSETEIKAPIADEDKPIASSPASLIRSGGIGGEAESPVQGHDPGSSDSTSPWQPDANKAKYAAGVMQVASIEEHQTVTGPLPPAVLQWEPAPRSVAGYNYSPEVFPAGHEESIPNDFELEDWDDDVDP